MISITRRTGSGLLSLIFTTMLVSACGGGGSSIADGGIRGTGKSVGPVSGFGSVIVNGVRYETDSAAFVVGEDDRATQDDLSEGMLVIVDVNEGDDGRADRIRYSDDLRGPLTGGFDPLSNRMVVLGQTVNFNSSTVFRGQAPVGTATPPLYVSVSGWYLDSGEFLASYVHFRSEFDRNTDDVELHGAISGFNGDESLQIGSLRVVYSQAEIEMGGDRNRFDAQQDLGAYVEIEGWLDPDGNLIADEIEEEDRDERLGDIDGTGIRIEGLITSGVDRGPSDTFEVNGITVRANPATRLMGGGFNQLQRGTRVYIDGVGSAQSLVVAKAIEIREPDSEVEARVQSIEPSVDNPEREGRLQVGGVEVEVTLRTIVVEGDDDNSQVLRFADLRIGDSVEITGFPRRDAEGGSYLEAVKLERDDDDDGEFELKGRVTSVEGQSFGILGVNMTTTPGTEYDDGLRDFTSIEADQRLEIEYRLDNGVLVAKEIERDEDDEDDLDDDFDDDNDIGDDGGDDDDDNDDD